MTLPTVRISYNFMCLSTFWRAILDLASYIRWFDDNLIGVGYSLSETDVAFLVITLKGDDYEAQKMIAQTEAENPSFSTAYIKEWYVPVRAHFMKSFYC